MLYKIKTFIRRWISSRLDLNRPANFPYLSGDNFKAIADHVLDEVCDFKPSQVSEGDVVFVRGNHLDEFFESKHPFIDARYILIVHNDDAATAERHIKFIEEEKVIHVFAANLIFSHVKATAIPVGINSRRYDRENVIISAARNYANSSDRKSRILYGFNPRTNMTERIPILETLKKTPLAETTPRVDKKTYQELTSKYKLIASPPGNGFDCLRTWEAIYLHTIPVVQKSSAVLSWKDLGIPLYIIDDWNSLSSLTEKDIDEIYATLSPGFDCEALWMPYWVLRIQKTQADFRAKSLPALLD